MTVASAITGPDTRPAPTARAAPSFTRVVLASAALGALLAGSGVVATLSAYLAAGAALWFAAFTRDVQRTVVATAYVAASDVVWRATDARFFWEGPKYVVIAALLLSLLRTVRTVRRPALPLLYLGALVPSVPLTLDHLGLFGARGALSSNLAGPVALGVAVLFFRQLRASWASIRAVLLALVAPAVTLAVVATIRLAEAGPITFGNESNFDTSGGFGPNQVSNILGLGALICLVLVVRERRLSERLVAAAVGVWLFGQCVLTFSRGGALNVVVAGSLFLLVELRNRGVRLQQLALVGLVVVASVAVFGRLDAFTGGALEGRYSEATSTGRTRIAQDDLHLWRTHLIAGVGPGVAKLSRQDPRDVGAAAHTEFTRLVAEHGLLGLLALIVLLSIMVRALALNSRSGQALTFALAVWVLVAMTHSAMRLSAMSFVFGLAALRVRDPAENVPPPASSQPPHPQQRRYLRR